MPKELPYFQFEPAQYLTGNIQFCSLEAQGLFINIQCHYWQRDCLMTAQQLYRKYPDNKKLIDELLAEGSIKIAGEKMSIEFLDKQHQAISVRKKRLSEAGKKGAGISNGNRGRKDNQGTISEDTKESTPQTEEAILAPKKEEVAGVPNFFYIGTALYKYAVSKYVKEELEITINSFMPSIKPVTLEQVLRLMDVEYCGATFSNIQHVRNAFKKCGKDLKSPRKDFNNKDNTIVKPPIKFG